MHKINKSFISIFYTTFDRDTLNRENVSFRDRDRKRLTRCHMASENFDAVLLLNIRVSI